MVLKPPTDRYSHGWDAKGLAPSPVMCSWTLCTQDLDEKTTNITLYLFDDDYTLLVGIDIHR